MKKDNFSNPPIKSIFSDGIDSKHKINVAPDKVIDMELVGKVSKQGITIEEIEKLQQEGFPVFSYMTQITVHGICDHNVYARIASNAWVFTNKNKSLGIKWDTIDIKKKKYIGKILNKLSSDYSINYKGEIFIYKKTSKEVKKYLNQVDVNLLKSGGFEVNFVPHSLSVWIGLPVGYYLQLVINGIYQKNVLPFLNQLLKSNYKSLEEIDAVYNKLVRKEEEERQKEQDEWKRKREKEKQINRKKFEKTNWHERLSGLGFKRQDFLTAIPKNCIIVYKDKNKKQIRGIRLWGNLVKRVSINLNDPNDYSINEMNDFLSKYVIKDVEVSKRMRLEKKYMPKFVNTEWVYIINFDSTKVKAPPKKSHPSTKIKSPKFNMDIKYYDKNGNEIKVLGVTVRKSFNKEINIIQTNQGDYQEDYFCKCFTRGDG